MKNVLITLVVFLVILLVFAKVKVNSNINYTPEYDSIMSERQHKNDGIKGLGSLVIGSTTINSMNKDDLNSSIGGYSEYIIKEYTIDNITLNGVTCKFWNGVLYSISIYDRTSAGVVKDAFDAKYFGSYEKDEYNENSSTTTYENNNVEAIWYYFGYGRYCFSIDSKGSDYRAAEKFIEDSKNNQQKEKYKSF